MVEFAYNNSIHASTKVSPFFANYCNYQQEDWVDFLAMAEFAYNNSIHASTKVSPFFANYGFHARFSISFLRFPSIRQPRCVPALYKMSIVTSPLSSMSLANSIRITLTIIAWSCCPSQSVAWFGCYAATSLPLVPARN